MAEPMTRLRLLRITAFLAAVIAAGPSAATAQASYDATFVFDRYMSPVAGATNLLTIHRELSRLEDGVLPLKVGAERQRLPLLAGIAYRAGKFIFLDVPQDHMLLVLGHEVFGHGTRLRELGVGRIGYSFDAPPPYGGGGAVTSFEGEMPDTPLAFLTVSMAGIEAQHVMADAIAERALAQGRWHYRDAWLYFENRDLAMSYMLDATERSAEGNDIADFTRSFKEACKLPACSPITLRQIKRGALLTLGDPMLYYAMYGFAASYVAEGKATSPVPMIPIGKGMHLLPSLGFQLTPFGTERLLRGAFRTDKTGAIGAIGARGAMGAARITTVTLRVGDTGASTPWGLDVGASDVRLYRALHARVSVSVWRQPPILSGQTSAPLKTGAGASATIALPLRRFTRSDWLHATVTAGYKSEGFVPGDQLGRGVILRIGLTALHH